MVEIVATNVVASRPPNGDRLQRQFSEQTNRVNSVGLLRIENYLNFIELFLVAKKLKIKNALSYGRIENKREHSSIMSVSFPILAPHPYPTYCRE